MPLLARVSLLLLTVASAACTRVGSSCNQEGRFRCEDPQTALECREGAWAELPCRGPGGCAEEGGTILCDTTRNEAGDGCASTAEGRGMCTGDGRGVLECRQGTFVRTQTCSSCTDSGGQVVCQP